MLAYDGSELAKIAIAEAANQLNHGREALVVTVWQPFNVGSSAENYRIRKLAEIVAEVMPGTGVTFAEGSGPDQRSYRVDCSKLARVLPAAIPQWTVRCGCEQLREAYARAGHPGPGTVMLAFHMLCHRDQAEAERLARGPLNRYLRSLVDAASGWTSGASSADYPGYDKVIAGLAAETFETQVAKCAAWIGTPARILDIAAT